MTVAERIRTGALPAILEGADWHRYRGSEVYEPGFAGWCRMWWGIAWVRLQAFEREAEAEWEAEDHEAAIAAGGRW